MYWKGYGTDGIKSKVRNAIENAKYLSSLVKQHKNFELILEPEFINVSFYYIPDRLRNMDKNEEKFKSELNLIAPKIKSEMVKRGNMMMAYQRQTQKNFKYINFLRPVLTVDKNRDDSEFIIKEVDNIGKNM